MMPAPQGDPALVGHGDDVMRVDVFQQEAHQAGAADVRAEEADPLFKPGQFGVSVSAQLLSCCAMLRRPMASR